VRLGFDRTVSLSSSRGGVLLAQAVVVRN